MIYILIEWIKKKKVEEKRKRMQMVTIVMKIKRIVRRIQMIGKFQEIKEENIEGKENDLIQLRIVLIVRNI